MFLGVGLGVCFVFVIGIEGLYILWIKWKWGNGKFVELLFWEFFECKMFKLLFIFGMYYCGLKLMFGNIMWI